MKTLDRLGVGGLINDPAQIRGADFGFTSAAPSTETQIAPQSMAMSVTGAPT